MRLIRIRDLRIVEERVFTLSYDLLKDKTRRIAFIPDGIQIRPDQASAAIKIIKRRGDFLLITIDETNYDVPVDERQMAKSTVIQLDLNNGTSTIKSFFESSASNFTTTVHGDYVFRLVQREKPVLNIYDLKTSALKFTHDLSLKPELKTTAYLRQGKNNNIEKSQPKAGLKTLAPGCF